MATGFALIPWSLGLLYCADAEDPQGRACVLVTGEMVSVHWHQEPGEGDWGRETVGTTGLAVMGPGASRW